MVPVVYDIRQQTSEVSEMIISGTRVHQEHGDDLAADVLPPFLPGVSAYLRSVKIIANALKVSAGELEQIDAGIVVGTAESGHIICYRNRTYNVLLTLRDLFC